MQQTLYIGTETEKTSPLVTFHGSRFQPTNPKAIPDHTPQVSLKFNINEIFIINTHNTFINFAGDMPKRAARDEGGTAKFLASEGRERIPVRGISETLNLSSLEDVPFENMMHELFRTDPIGTLRDLRYINKHLRTRVDIWLDHTFRVFLTKKGSSGDLANDVFEFMKATPGLELIVHYVNRELFVKWSTELLRHWDAKFPGVKINGPTLLRLIIGIISKRSDILTAGIGCAIQWDNIKNLKFWVRLGANLNDVNKDGKSLLWKASFWNKLILTRFLIKEGADINQANNNGESPLWIACSYGHDQIAKLLIETGADINQANENGESSLWIACQYGRDQIAKLLIKNGADVNKTDNKGRSPLWIASSGLESFSLRGEKILNLLIKNGANINLMDDSNKTPLDKANELYQNVPMEPGYTDIVYLLRKAGAKTGAEILASRAERDTR